jgi:hypothetical protein
VTPLEYREDETIARVLGRVQDSDDVYEHVALYRAAFEHALALLYVEHYDLHPHYGNTSRRGRGIGGQAVTQQCSVVRPDDGEQLVLWAIDDALRQGIEGLQREGRNLLDYRRQNVPPVPKTGI